MDNKFVQKTRLFFCGAVRAMHSFYLQSLRRHWKLLQSRASADFWPSPDSNLRPASFLRSWHLLCWTNWTHAVCMERGRQFLCSLSCLNDEDGR